MKKYYRFLLLTVYSFLIISFPRVDLYAGPSEVLTQNGPGSSPTAPVGPEQTFLNTASTPPPAGYSEETEFSPLSLPENEEPSLLTLIQNRAFFVAKNGSDSNDGSEDSPWKTIQRAVFQLQAGDTVFISEGTYEESIQIQSSGTADGFITLEGVGTVVIDGSALGSGKSGVDTNGKDYLRFKNLTVNHFSAAGIQVEPGSDFIEIDGLKADGNVYAVRIESAANVTVRNAYAVNSNNAFRAFGASRDLLFENIETYNSQDVYPGMNPDYLNGDGFVFESNVSGVTIRNVISANHWDAGFDIKASNVLIENVEAYGNKNNIKTWGENIVIKSSSSHHAKRQIRSDGSNVEGNGITVNSGTTSVISMTFADNEDHEIQVYAGARLDVRDSIVVRRNLTGLLFENKGTLTSGNVLWYNTALEKPDFQLAPKDFWGDPGFADWAGKNYHLSESSSALNFGSSSSLSAFDLDGNPRTVGSRSDLGAYEIQTVVPAKFKGLANGDTVGGKIYVQPDPVFWPTVRSVTYSVDGRKVNSTSSKPYWLGGSSGYSTAKLSAGVHFLTVMIEVGKNQKVKYVIAFRVDPSLAAASLTAAPPPPSKKK